MEKAFRDLPAEETLGDQGTGEEAVRGLGEVSSVPVEEATPKLLVEEPFDTALEEAREIAEKVEKEEAAEKDREEEFQKSIGEDFTPPDELQ